MNDRTASASDAPNATPTSRPPTGAPGQVPAAPSAPSSGRRGWLFAFSGLAALFCAGVLTQVFLAGLGLLVEPRYLGWRATFAHLLGGLVLPMLVVGAVGRAGPRALALSAGLFFLIGLQYAFIHGLSGPFRALHLVNAFALFVVSWQVARAAAARAAAQKTRGASSRAGPAAGTDASRQRSRVDSLLGAAVFLVAAASIALVGAASPGERGQAAQPLGAAAEAAPRAGATGDGAKDLPGEEHESAGAHSTSSTRLGAKVFADNCSGCLGESSQGHVGPALAGNDALEDRDHVRQRVSRGGGIMPAFERSLTPEQVDAVVDHVRSSWGNDF